MSQISLQNLKKSFGKTQVIHDLSIDVKDGELIVIVGPSGCGKSTLLRMVAGLEDANEGNILIDNKKVNELEPMERNIAMVFQNYALYPHMTVFGNMAYGLKIAKVPKDEPAIMYAIAGALAAKATSDNFDKICTYAGRMAPEFQVVLMRDALSRTRSLGSHPAYQQWVSKNATEIL